MAGVMWDADLSTKVADPRLAGEVAAVGELRRVSRSFETLSSSAAARRVLGEWVDCYLFLRAGLLPLICRHVNAGTNVAHTCSGNGSGATSPSGPCDAGSLDVGVAELRMSLAFKLSAGDCECVKELNGVTTAIRPVFFEHGACTLEIRMTRLTSGSTVEVHAVFLQNLPMEASSQPPLKMVALSLGRSEDTERFAQNCNVVQFTSLEEKRQLVGDNLAPSSRLMLLEKVKHDGNVKLRVILICPQSAELAVISDAERVLLARPLDEMFDMVELMAASEQRPETDAEYFVVEFTEAKGTNAHRSATSLLSFSEAITTL